MNLSDYRRDFAAYNSAIQLAYYKYRAGFEEVLDATGGVQECLVHVIVHGMDRSSQPAAGQGPVEVLLRRKVFEIDGEFGGLDPGCNGNGMASLRCVAQ